MIHHYHRYIVLCCCLCLALTLSAQRTKKRPVKKPVVVETPVDPRLQRMTQNTQRIVFIDSMVVPRNEILSRMNLTPRTGLLKQDGDTYSYQNEVGTRKIYVNDNRLYTSELVNGDFTNNQELKGLFIVSAVDTLNCPFLMNDGQTLYFAAKGSESIGGYDIFVTRYNSETHSFLKPENIGMPFNSTADDLLYVIDEGTNIGYFATTRRQPEGYACIYRFIPSETRQTYAECSEEELKQLADLQRISDTWGDGNARKEALARLNAQTSSYDPHTTTDEMAFVINDRTIYTNLSDFRSADNVTRYRQLLDLLAQKEQLERALHVSRTVYQQAADDKRQTLWDDILRDEAQLEQLRQDIHRMEKDIRNSENQFINNLNK